MRSVFGGVEGGGTKFNLIVGTGPDNIIDELRIPTTTPDETLAHVIDFFERPRDEFTISALGVASFGPIDLDPVSPTYGHVTTTPKPYWKGADVVGRLRGALGIPIGWETDVNAAALGEQRWGAGKDADPLVYLTVGTGIGGGAIVRGQPVHGLLHPEMGHLILPTIDGDTFPGICPYHGRCLEGVASGPALRARLGKPAEETTPDDPVWDLEAHYLAIGLLSIVYVLSPRRIVAGGGVLSTPGLLDRVRSHMLRLNGRYMAQPALTEEIDSYLVPPALGGRSGVMGAIELARFKSEDLDSCT